ncbi:hypothetical protein [Caminibacter sp.]
MKTINKLDFTKDKYIVLNEKERLVLEVETGKQFIATPTDFPEDKVVLQTPLEAMETEEKLLKKADEFAAKLKKEIFGNEIPEKDDDFDFPTKWNGKSIKDIKID